MAVNHEVAHQIITGMSFTDEGRDLVNRLEAMRYYHRDGESFYLGDGARLIISWNENPSYDDNKIVGVVYVPGTKNGKLGHESLFINKACWPHDTTEAALFWSFPKDMEEVWEVIDNQDDTKGTSYIEPSVISKIMKTANPPKLIPLELAHWATELVIHRSDWAERPADESRPVWREILVKNPGKGNGTMRTLIKVPSAEIGLTLTSLDETGNVREIPVVSGDARDVFARKYHQEKTVIKRRLPSPYSVIEKPFADWEMELLDGDVKQWETAVQELAETHCKFANMGNGLIMRDLVNAVRDISYVKPEDLQYLRIDDDGKRKHAISTVVAAYKDEDIDNDLIENDYGDDALYPSVMGAFELTASMRKMLNMVTDYKHRDYFDSISPVQAIVHLVNDNYEPHDIEF